MGRTEIECVDVRDELPLVPHVVAVCDDIGAGVAQLLRDLARETCAARGVLAIHDREIDLVFLP